MFIVPNAFWLLWLWTHQHCDWWKWIWNNFLHFYSYLNAFLNHIKFLCLPLHFRMVKNNCVPPEQDFNRAIAVEQFCFTLALFHGYLITLHANTRNLNSLLCYLKPSSIEEWLEIDTNSFCFFVFLKGVEQNGGISVWLVKRICCCQKSYYSKWQMVFLYKMWEVSKYAIFLLWIFIPQLLTWP